MKNITIIFSFLLIVFSSAVMANNDPEFTIKTYPNPVENVLTIEFNSASLTTIKLTNIIGEELKEIEFNSTQNGILEWDLSEFSNGVYFITAESNDFTKTIRIVKEN